MEKRSAFRASEPARDLRVCTPRFLPPEKRAEADKIAIEHNPENRRDDADLPPPDPESADRLVVERRVYWGKGRAHLTVGFLDNPPHDLRVRILSHMNAWGETADVKFVESSAEPQVRIARLDSPLEMSGYWSYLGTDILSIAEDQPTMNLEGFTMDTSDAEFVRVIRHETGHTLGFPHEHMRAELIERLDEEKVIAEFMRTQGWSRQTVINQLLIPLEKSSILGSRAADANSIMCYQIPGSLTTDGLVIPGGTDIGEIDRQIAAKLYPKPVPTA